MISNLRFLLILSLLMVPQFTQAFPFAISRKIRERPEAFDLGPVGGIAEMIIQEAEDIEEVTAKVGKPSVKLNVILIKPKDYGFNVSGTTEENKKGEVLGNFSINVSSRNLDEDDFFQVLSPEKQKELVEKRNLSFGPEAREVTELMKLAARKGSVDVPEKGKTIFFLNGYGVPNRLALPWALVLAKKGYQVILPDLPGFGKSGGRGPTYGKREARDLVDLLTQLQSSGKIDPSNAIGVMGVSYGAGIASLWTASDPRVTGTVLIAPYARGDETIAGAAETLKEQLELPFPIDPESVKKGIEMAAKRLGITWEEVAPEKAIPKIQHPILFVTSPSDDIIPASVVEKLYHSAREGSALKTVNVPHLYLGFYLDALESDISSYFDKNLVSPVNGK